MSAYVEEDIASYLESQISYLRRSSTVTTAGNQNLFIGDLPLTPVRAASIYEYTGDLPIFTMGGLMVERPRIQVTTRDSIFENARSMMFDIFNALADVGPLTLGGTVYQRIRANSRPAETSPDGANNSLFGCSFVMWRDKT